MYQYILILIASEPQKPIKEKPLFYAVFSSYRF